MKLFKTLKNRICLFGKRNKYLSRNDGYHEEHLLKFAHSHFVAAMLLVKEGDYRSFFTRGYLFHLSLELILKAYCLHVKNQFLAIHDLKRLFKDASLAQVYKENKTLIDNLNNFYYLRYSLQVSDIGDGDEQLLIEISNKLDFGHFLQFST